MWLELVNVAIAITVILLLISLHICIFVNHGKIMNNIGYIQERVGMIQSHIMPTTATINITGGSTPTADHMQSAPIEHWVQDMQKPASSIPISFNSRVMPTSLLTSDKTYGDMSNVI